MEGMVALVGDHNLRHALKQAASAQASTFHWERTAEQTLQVYERALSGSDVEATARPRTEDHFA